MAALSYKRIAADSLVALVAKVLSVACVYLTHVALARFYGPELFGTFFIAFNLVLTLSFLTRLGMDNGLLRFAAVLKSERQVGGLPRLLWPAVGTALLLSGLAGLGVYVSRAWLAGYFNAPQLPLLLFFFVLAMPLHSLNFLFQETIRGLGMVRWAIIGQYLVIPGSLLVLLVGGSYLVQGTVSQGQALGLAFLLSCLLGLIFLGGRALWATRRQAGGDSGTRFQELWRYSWPLCLNAVLGLALTTWDVLILGLFTSPAEVAFYGAAAKTAVLITFPLLAINGVVPPLFGQFYQRHDLASLEQVAQTTARWMYYITLPLTLLVILLAPQILAIFGPQFAAARLALSILAVAQLVNVAAGSVAFVLIMTAHQHTLLRLQLLVAGGTVPMMLGGAAFWGMNGLAVATALGVAGLNILMAWAVWRHLHIKTFVAGGGWVTASGLLATLFFLAANLLVGLVPATMIFLGSYLLLISKALFQEVKGIVTQPLWLRREISS